MLYIDGIKKKPTITEDDLFREPGNYSLRLFNNETSSIVEVASVIQTLFEIDSDMVLKDIEEIEEKGKKDFGTLSKKSAERCKEVFKQHCKDLKVEIIEIKNRE